MNNGKESVERRSCKRFPVKEGAFAVLRPQFKKLGQIVDISLEGLAFHYVITGNQLDSSIEMDIFLAGNGFYLERLPIKTVSDLKIAKKFVTSSIRARRCGVQFGELNSSQSSQLEYFLQHHTKI